MINRFHDQDEDGVPKTRTIKETDLTRRVSITIPSKE